MLNWSKHKSLGSVLVVGGMMLLLASKPSVTGAAIGIGTGSVIFGTGLSLTLIMSGTVIFFLDGGKLMIK